MITGMENQLVKKVVTRFFKRWEAIMAPRVYPSGNLTLPTKTVSNMILWEKEFGRNKNQNGGRAGNWTELGPIGSPTGPSPYSRTGTGRTSFLTFHPSNSNIMFVGTPDGGLWKSNNGGSSWTTNSDFLTAIGCSGLVIDPTNSQIMYLATGDIEGNRSSIGILKSMDGGITWNTSGTSWPASNLWTPGKLLMNPSNPLNMLMATNIGILRTTDGWASYNFVQNTIGFKDMEFKPGDPNTIYASGTELWKSTDNGVTWTQITSGLPTTNVSNCSGCYHGQFQLCLCGNWQGL
ncbi:MAG: hypothetical protein IPO37_22155 [Saprospiraceae bacterium]|nr:hypothetical protein [Saprospiraceae bacterium]